MKAVSDEGGAASGAAGWHELVFARRGTLLAIPAVLLVAFGKPSKRSLAGGLTVALAGEAIRCWAVGYSGATTRADRVTAPALVTAGPYAYVRNPLYVGNLVTGLGFTIAFTGANRRRVRVGLAALGLGTMLAVYTAIVPHEERFLRERFGADFDDYAARVPRIVPRLRPSGPQSGSYDRSVIAKAESRTFMTFGAMLAVLALKVARY